MPFRFVRLQRRWRHPRGVLSRMPPRPTTQAFPLPPIARESSGRRQAEAHSTPAPKKADGELYAPHRHEATAFPNFFPDPNPNPKKRARSLQPGKRPRPPTRREVPAFPRRRGVLPCREPSAGEASPTADAQGSAGISPSPGRASMQGAFSRGSVPDRRRAGKCRHFPVAGACFHAGSLQPGKRPRPPTRREVPAFPRRRGVLPCREPSAGEASPTADAQGSAGISPSPGRASMQGAQGRQNALPPRDALRGERILPSRARRRGARSGAGQGRRRPGPRRRRQRASPEGAAHGPAPTP